MDIERLTVDPIAQEAIILIESERWSKLDDCFLSYAKNRNADLLANRLGSTLSFLLNRKFEVIISNTNRKNPFFGMYVFPSKEWVDRAVKKIVVDGVKFAEVYRTWGKIDSWIIEIDAQLFDQFNLHLNPRELTAILLHEVGHVIQSDGVPEIFYRLYKGYSITEKIQKDPAIKALYMLYMLPLASCCMLKLCARPDSQNKNIEIQADRFVIMAGYGDDLLTAMNKIIHAYGYQGISESNEELAEAKIEEVINWASLNARSFVYRKNHLKDELYLRSKKTNSVYIADLTATIYNTMGIKLRERYNGIITDVAAESILSDTETLFPSHELIYDSFKKSSLIDKIHNYERENKRIAMEAFRLHKEPKMPTQFDIDAIAIEIDRMENQHDRIYILDLIYYHLDSLDKMDGYINGNIGLEAKYRSKINRYRDSLESMRKTVLEKHNFGKEYKLWVKYPEGYEG